MPNSRAASAFARHPAIDVRSDSTAGSWTTHAGRLQRRSVSIGPAQTRNQSRGQGDGGLRVPLRDRDLARHMGAISDFFICAFYLRMSGTGRIIENELGSSRSLAWRVPGEARAGSLEGRRARSATPVQLPGRLVDGLLPLLARDLGERHVADKAAPQDDIGFEVSQPEQALGERFVASARIA